MLAVDSFPKLSKHSCQAQLPLLLTKQSCQPPAAATHLCVRLWRVTPRRRSLTLLLFFTCLPMTAGEAGATSPASNGGNGEQAQAQQQRSWVWASGGGP